MLFRSISTANLDFLLAHREVDPGAIDAVLLNAKGFGGNNATASLLSPHVTMGMLEKRHGGEAIKRWEKAHEKVAARAELYHQQTLHEQITPIYKYDHDVREGKDLSFSNNSLSLRGYDTPVDLDLPNTYRDMC